MTTRIAVETPFQYILGLDGKPLDAGYVYFGQLNLNPEASPVQVYWDEALTIPAAQPIRTQGGYLVRNGTPARIYTAGPDCSMLVRDKNSLLVWSSLNTAGVQAYTAPADQISYLPAGAGAVVTTVQDKLRESIRSSRDNVPLITPITPNGWYWDYTNPDGAGQQQLKQTIPATVNMAGGGNVQGTGLIFSGDTSAQTPAAGLAEINLLRMYYSVNADAGEKVQVHCINGLMLVANEEGGSGNEDAGLLLTLRSVGPTAGTAAVGIWGADLHVEKAASVLDGKMVGLEVGVHKAPALGASRCAGIDMWSGDRSGITASQAGDAIYVHGNRGWTNFLKFLHTDETTEVVKLTKLGSLTVRAPTGSQNTLFTTNSSGTDNTLTVGGYTGAVQLNATIKADAGSGNVWFGSSTNHDLVLRRNNVEYSRVYNTATGVALKTSTVTAGASAQVETVGKTSAGIDVGFKAGSGLTQCVIGSTTDHNVQVMRNSVANFHLTSVGSYKMVDANQTIGSGSATLGAACPAISMTPQVWEIVQFSDGTTGYRPIWK